MPQFWSYPFVPTPNFEGGVRGLLEPTNITGHWTVYWEKSPKYKMFENSISKIVITIIKPIVIENTLFWLPNLKSL